MSAPESVSPIDEKPRARRRYGLCLGGVFALLVTSPLFAQAGSGQTTGDFDELIRREELKSGPASAPPAVQPPATSADDLARMVQVELKRVGCDPGAPDGIWGPASRQAAASFDRFGKAQYATDTPSEALLQDLRARRGRVCSAEASPPPVPTAPAETRPEPAPPTTEEISLAGVWSGRSDCPLDLGFTITLTPSGRQQYRISGSSGISGWVSGSQVHMEAQVLINHIVYDGTVDSPTAMSGKQKPSLLLGASCDWQAQKR